MFGIPLLNTLSMLQRIHREHARPQTAAAIGMVGLRRPKL
jgi:hypothetical protein